MSQANTDLKNVIKNLRSGSEEHALAVLRHIRAIELPDESLETITDSIALLSGTSDYSQNSRENNRSRHEVEFHESSAVEEYHAPSSDGLRSKGKRFIDLSLNDSQNDELKYHRESMEILPISQWTSVRGTDEQFSELLALLWTWDTTFTRVIDRSTFEDGL